MGQTLGNGGTRDRKSSLCCIRLDARDQTCHFDDRLLQRSGQPFNESRCDGRDNADRMDAHSERRVVTCLFIDVAGSTDLMMRVGPDIAADLDYIVGDIDATADVGTLHVTGQCPEELQFEVIAYHHGHEIGYEHWWTDEGATFDADFSGESTAMSPGDSVLVGCQLGTGDWLQKWFVAQ